MPIEQNLIDQLTATGDYKVIRRLKPVVQYHDDTGAQKLIALYLDTEGQDPVSGHSQTSGNRQSSRRGSVPEFSTTVGFGQLLRDD